MSRVHDYRELDALLVSRIRLAVMTLLATVDQADFAFIRDQVGASDGNLGAHMRKLADAGYVIERKRFHRRKPRTTYTLTDTGRQALDRYLEQLQDMISGSSQQ
jgi:DNA-binding HxlR family transcriptional regulator